MQKDTATVIHVGYRYIEGYHVFTSEDVYGLYVAEKDSQKAFDAVAPSLQKLIMLNEGVKCVVEHAQTYIEFQRMLKHQQDHTVPHPSIIASRQYIVKCAA